jgi:hypothetical protein
MERPVFLLVSGEESRRDGLRRDLRRRFGADYRVVAADSATSAGGLLAELAAAGVEVALIIADEHLAGEPAVDFLAGRTACIAEPSGCCSSTGATGPPTTPRCWPWPSGRSTAGEGATAIQLVHEYLD